MDTTFIGEITGKDIKTGEKEGNTWKMAIYTLSGSFKCSTFDSDIIDAFNEGHIVRVTTHKDKSGKYNNLLEMRLAQEGETPTPPPSRFEHSSKTPQYDIEKDKRIVRQNCNARAIEVLNLYQKVDPEGLKACLKANDGSFTQVVTLMAKQFEIFVWEG